MSNRPMSRGCDEQGCHEQGLADFAAPTWFAVILPRGSSEPIIRKLNQAALATLDMPSVQERLNALARWPLWETRTIAEPGV
jgi:tripartite-type tricarboxylate transporter receptor subunit TctC